MAKLKTLLKRLKYNTKYLIKANNEIPLNFRIFERRNTNFQQFLIRECLGATNMDMKIDLNEKIPIFGYLYRRVAILVDRSSPESRKRVYEKSKKRLDKGLSVCIFPEGGVPDPSIILDQFKNGAFSLAVEFQIPIVPMTFLDCEKKCPYFVAYNHYVGSPGSLRANVHNFIETKGLTKKDVPALKQKVFDIIYNDLKADINQTS